MRNIFIFLIILFLTSCTLFHKTQNRENEVAPSTPYFIDPTKFPFQNLAFFDLRGWDASRRSSLKHLDSIDYTNFILPINENHQKIYESECKYFSVQKSTIEEKIITLLIESEETGTCALHLLIYNTENKLISNNIVASTGGDGGSEGNSYGSFTNDSTYLMTSVGTQLMVNTENEEVLLLDSAIRTFRFYPNQNFKSLNAQVFPQKTLDTEMIKVRNTKSK